jgi:hypothetical protein
MASVYTSALICLRIAVQNAFLAHTGPKLLNKLLYQSVIKSFRTESITQYRLAFGITRSEATQRVMVTTLTTLTHTIAIQLHVVAESCTICSSHSRRPVRKLLDTPSYSLTVAASATFSSFLICTAHWMINLSVSSHCWMEEIHWTLYYSKLVKLSH